MNEQSQNAQSSRKLVWKDEYSVGIKEIDNQHQVLFEIINQLIETINTTPSAEEVTKIIDNILKYKIAHFATEEKYFHQFNFEGTAEHEAAHRLFDQSVSKLREDYRDDVVGLAFALVDFLEDWLIGHLMGADKKYTQCFHDHGMQ